MQFKFTIQAINVIESQFALNPDFKGEGTKSIELSFGLNIAFKTKDKTVDVRLSIMTEDKTLPFMFNLTTLGTFVFEKMPSKTDLEQVIHINCAAIMFPYLREAIADMTRRAGILPLHLDPINFIALYEDSKKKQTNVSADKSKKVTKA